MSDRSWVVWVGGDGPGTRNPALRSMLKPWHSPITHPRLRPVLAAAVSTLSGTALAMSFESGDDPGLPRCARLTLRTMMCDSHGMQVAVTITVDRKVASAEYRDCPDRTAAGQSW